MFVVRNSLGLMLASSLACAASPTPAPGPGGDQHDIIIRNALIYDGLGGKPYAGDIAIDRDTITTVGDLETGSSAKLEIDASGLAVAPGFINVLSWSTASLVADGRSQGEIRQGVTLEVFGEGWSMGPLNDELKAYSKKRQADILYDIEWDTLDGYLEWLVGRGISPNIASFVGATTVRANVLGFENRAPNPDELARMQALVRQAMQDGALGVGSALIYAPGSYAKTDELIALAKVAGEHGGMYITHMRSEANQLLEAVDETIAIANAAKTPAEIYHLKAAGEQNWSKLDQVIERVEKARAAGTRITADMYMYTAGATGLSATMPPWVQEGGHDAWAKRLKDPKIRKKLRKEMTTPTDEWENLLLLSGGADKVLLTGFKSAALKPLAGKTLAEVAKMRGKSPEETAMDLVVEDGSRVGAVFFLMSEDNVKKKIALPWMSFCSDSPSKAPEGVFLKSQDHPRAYGSFARLLGKYVRDENVIPLEEAIRRLTSFPAENLAIERRAALKPGYFADIVVFDPAKVGDLATYENPHQYSVGVVHVLVNGEPVLKDGEHTGATPGRVVRGPGYEGP